MRYKKKYNLFSTNHVIRIFFYLPMDVTIEKNDPTIKIAQKI